MVEIPKTAKTLTREQVVELDRQLAKLRHAINNHLSLITAATEIMKLKPETAERMLGNISKQPPKIMEDLRNFTVVFDAAFDISRPDTASGS